MSTQQIKTNSGWISLASLTVVLALLFTTGPLQAEEQVEPYREPEVDRKLLDRIEILLHARESKLKQVDLTVKQLFQTDPNEFKQFQQDQKTMQEKMARENVVLDPDISTVQTEPFPKPYFDGQEHADGFRFRNDVAGNMLLDVYEGSDLESPTVQYGWYGDYWEAFMPGVVERNRPQLILGQTHYAPTLSTCGLHLPPSLAGNIPDSFPIKRTWSTLLSITGKFNRLIECRLEGDSRAILDLGVTYYGGLSLRAQMILNLEQGGLVEQVTIVEGVKTRGTFDEVLSETSGLIMTITWSDVREVTEGLYVPFKMVESIKRVERVWVSEDPVPYLINPKGRIVKMPTGEKIVDWNKLEMKSYDLHTITRTTTEFSLIPEEEDLLAVQPVYPVGTIIRDQRPHPDHPYRFYTLTEATTTRDMRGKVEGPTREQLGRPAFTGAEPVQPNYIPITLVAIF
ncbi:MAG: hypothetical protein KDA65_01745 [Planctomycetaceae bacterium]|nr:hypothetical protein [Planctomycetaceae bacterium]